MSFKEIKELRQAGKLDEALQMANKALESEPYNIWNCLLYTSPSPRDRTRSRMPSSA